MLQSVNGQIQLTPEQTGLIYRITSTVNLTEYHGLTIDTLKERWNGHLHGARTAARGGSDGCRHLYHAMNHYGYDKFKIEVIEDNLPMSTLGKRETYWIMERSLHPKGYNLTTGGDHHQHHQETKERISKSCKKHEFSIGLPMYLTYRKHGKYHTYRVMDHPLCDHAEFSEHEYGSREAAREAGIKFLVDLEAKGVKYIAVANKANPKLPPGISTMKGGGYRVGITKNKIHSPESFFRDPSMTDEEQLEAAVACLKQLRQNWKP